MEDLQILSWSLKNRVKAERAGDRGEWEPSGGGLTEGQFQVEGTVRGGSISWGDAG